MDKLKDNYKPALVALCIIIIPVVIAILLKEDEIGGGRVKQETFEIKNYAINEIIPVYVDDEGLVKKYYSDFIDLMINDPKSAFALLDDESLMEQFTSYKAFEKYVNELKQTRGFYTATIRNYSSQVDGGKKLYYVMDSIGNEYIFVETSIMNYTVIV